MSTHDELILSDAQLDQLADLLALKLTKVKAPAPNPMLTVEDVCATYQVSRGWVYENASRLGGVKLGPGRRAPLRFDSQHVAAAFSPLGTTKNAGPATGHVRTRRRRTRPLHPVYDG